MADDAALSRVADAFAAALAGPGTFEVDLTPLDRVALPVWSVWARPGGGAPIGGIGYGGTPLRARVGALGEALELASSRRALTGTVRIEGSYAEVVRSRGADGVVDPRLLALPAGEPYDDGRPLHWLPVRRLRDGAELLAPAEFVTSAPGELTGPPPPGGWLTVPVTNGMGAGTTLDQAVVHGTLEVLQRDGNGLVFRALDRGRALELDDVRDEVARKALALAVAAGIDVIAKVASTELGLPNVYVVGAADDDGVLAATACGEAVHPDREVALCKAVLEFLSARARKLFMHGPLDAVAAVAPDGYLDAVLPFMDPAAEEPRVLAAMVEWLRLPRAAWRPLVERTVLSRSTSEPFSGLPTREVPADRLLADVAGRLSSAGFDVLFADVSVGAGVHAAKVLVPGTEVETVAYDRIGERGVARLRSLGRDDLVRVGDRPVGPGWATVHLTVDATERLGGPAWLDRESLAGAAAGLLPLYREPSRHTAAQVLDRG